MFKSGDLLGLNYDSDYKFIMCRLYISNKVCVSVLAGNNSYFRVLTKVGCDNTWARIA